MESILLSVTYLPLGSLSGPGRDHQRERERGSWENQSGCERERKEERKVDEALLVLHFFFSIIPQNLLHLNCFLLRKLLRMKRLRSYQELKTISCRDTRLSQLDEKRTSAAAEKLSGSRPYWLASCWCSQWGPGGRQPRVVTPTYKSPSEVCGLLFFFLVLSCTGWKCCSKLLYINKI